LPPLDDILDLVTAAQILPLAAQLVGRAFVDRGSRRARAGLFGFLALVLMLVVILVVTLGLLAALVIVIVIVVVLVRGAEPFLFRRMFGFLAE
jgi:hypothetical protein